MASEREEFWKQSSFVVIGNSARMPFPQFTYRGLKQNQKKAYAIDPAAEAVLGDPVFRDLRSLPEPVEAAVLEVPQDETADWIRKVAEAGIRNVWLHMDTETPEALTLARQNGIRALTGTCAVMYLLPREFPHNFHGAIMRLFKKY